MKKVLCILLTALAVSLPVVPATAAERKAELPRPGHGGKYIRTTIPFWQTTNSSFLKIWPNDCVKYSKFFVTLENPELFYKWAEDYENGIPARVVLKRDILTLFVEHDLLILESYGTADYTVTELPSDSNDIKVYFSNKIIKTAIDYRFAPEIPELSGSGFNQILRQKYYFERFEDYDIELTPSLGNISASQAVELFKTNHEKDIGNFFTVGDSKNWAEGKFTLIYGIGGALDICGNICYEVTVTITCDTIPHATTYYYAVAADGSGLTFEPAMLDAQWYLFDDPNQTVLEVKAKPQ